jgi:hypothetical protein
MKTITTLAALFLSTAAFAGPNATQQIAALPNGAVKSALAELNNEDQRLTDGSYNRETGTLTLYTQDMVAGSDKDISRRAVVIEGLAARDGTDGRNGQDFDAAGHRAALASATAMGGLTFVDLGRGELGWAAGLGGQFDGEGAFAAGINFGLTDRVMLNASLARSFDGGSVSGFIGASGRF